jgi:hypothetical protein
MIWTTLWLVWFAMFLVVEGAALFNKTAGDTLSEHVWKWFATGGGVKMTGWVRLRRVVLMGFLAWLLVHFMSGGRLM